MPMQVCLVVEPDGDRDVGGRLTVEQATTGGLDAAAGEVAVWREPVGAGEAADQVGRVRVQQGGCVAQGESRHGVGVEQVPQVRGEPVGCGLGGRCAQVPADPVADQREPALGLQRGTAGLEGLVQLVDAGAQQRVVEGRGVDRGADQRLVEDLRVDVEHPFTEAVLGGGPPGVGHVRRQQGHRRSQRPVLVVVQVVADRALVDDEQRPGVVGVLGIRVIGEPCVEDLDDPRH
ncbi:hypothetical protein GCM10010464_31290 [Pseudonocardia yunnanensis]